MVKDHPSQVQNKNNTTPHFRVYTKHDSLYLTNIRRFETRVGERIQTIQNHDIAAVIDTVSAPYVLIGIPENIGVKANYGTGGTSSIWIPFLQSFLNTQSNDFLSGDEILLLGSFDFSDLENLIDQMAHDDEEKIEAYRHAVNTIDEEVEKLIKLLVSHNKIPIVIGGGHNNAYPIIKGTAKGLQAAQKVPLSQINCINLDAHTDYRPSEGRHSGNAFRYAEEDGFLQKYCVIGLHENYLPQNVWMDIVNNPFIDCITFEDIFIHEKRTFRQAVSHAIQFTDDGYAGIELDMDSIENVISSALSPTGVSAIHARQYINLCAAHAAVGYLHICEGATRLTNGTTNETTGKLISYLVSDFIKAHSSKINLTMLR
ncbi:MAG: arginase family protein [Flavisolibacter sp.]|nr:arginase family protein [Flavisolibacter sp.]